MFLSRIQVNPARQSKLKVRQLFVGNGMNVNTFPHSFHVDVNISLAPAASGSAFLDYFINGG
jgi:hypothetical protein